MNYRMICYILGGVLKIESACMVLPLIFALCYREGDALYTLAISIAICLVAGFLLSLSKPEKKTMYAKEGFVAVALSWIIMSIFGALPFIISGYIPNFVDAFFEIVSGFTTTGASILTDVEALPKSLLVWRSFTHWIGGMGVLVFLMAIMPLAGGGNLHLLRAESPGPSVGKLVPKVKSSAMLLYGIYIGLTVVQFIFMLAGGLDIFQALTLTFGTAGTGGFSILNSGCVTYSPYIQYVITVFMILYGIDFSLYYALLFRQVKEVLKSEELRSYLLIILLSVMLIYFNSSWMFSTVEEALRNITFTVGAIITTTGYATTDFSLWPQFSQVIIILLMFIGACAGSTGGGIKVSRIIILFKTIAKEVRTSVHPHTVLKVKMNGKILPHETIRGVNVYMSAYVVIFFVSLLIICLETQFDFLSNFTAVATTLNNIGPGLGMIGPMSNFSAYSPLSKVVMSICMLVGRLEIFPMLLLLSPYTWKK